MPRPVIPGRVRRFNDVDLVVGLSTQDLTSGSPTAVTVLTLPDGYRADEISVYVEDFSTDAANQAPLIQLSTNSGFVTSGYGGKGLIGGLTSESNSAGFFIGTEANQDAATTITFQFTLRRYWSNIWSCQHLGFASQTANQLVGGLGKVDLSDFLTAVRITTSGGSASFDGGTAITRYR